MNIGTFVYNSVHKNMDEYISLNYKEREWYCLTMLFCLVTYTEISRFVL